MAWKRRWAAYGAATTMLASFVLVVAAVPAAATPIAPPSLVDDGVYPYPDAAAILAEQNVELISGDGHIVLADCSTPPVGDIGLLKVFTTDETIGADGIGRVCFTVNASSGVLNLRVPGVYEIRGDGQQTGTGHQVTAELHSDDGQDLTVAVDPDGSTQVGLGADPNASPTMLLRLTSGTGPAPVTGSQPAVGKIASAERTCTATLVAPRWVLSAAGCFAGDPLQPHLAESAPASPTHVVFAGHPAVAVNWFSPRTGRDVLLARLATPINDVTPIALATSVAPTGVALSASGFGRTTQWVTDQQQSPQITFTASTSTTLTAGSGPLVCAGMAGAPVFASGKVAAVLTQAGQAGCLGVTSSGSAITAERTDDLATWFTAVTTTTAAHTWTLADMPAGASSGSPVTTPVADSVYTGTGLPMTPSGGVTWTTGDSYSPAIAFDGSGGLRASGPAVATDADFSLAAWVKPTTAGGTVLSQYFSSIRGPIFSPSFMLSVDERDMSWTFSMAQSGSRSTPWDTARTSAGSAPAGVWSHVVVTYNAARRVAIVYVNGVNMGALTRLASTGSNGPFRIGARDLPDGSVGDYFGGQISQVQTWNTVVTTPAKVDHDLNGDGWPDLAAADSTGNLWLYPGTSASGLSTFAARVQITSGWTGMRWAITDWDVDGLADLLGIDAAGTLKFSKNLGLYGTAMFADPVTIGSGWTNYLHGVGNADTDPHPDHVGIATATGKMYFYPQGSNATEIKSSGFGAGYRIYVADFTGDGRGDVVVINPTGGMSLYPNTGGTGLAMLGSASTIGSGWSALKATAFDLSHDGQPDMVALNAAGDVLLYAHKPSGWAGTTTIATGWNTANITSIG